MIEIGSFCGLSTNLISYFKLKKNVKNKLFCSDAWNFEGAEKKDFLGGHPYLKHSDYKEFVRESFIRNVKFFSGQDLPYAIELFSDDFFAEWIHGSQLTDIFGRSIQLGGSISFAFIDGNHQYDFVRRDFYNVDRLLEVGGFLLFDDSADGTQWEVKQVITEVLESERYELVKKNPNYFFKKLKHL
ncbi:class I SAM-dependent methyltransferase [Zarconia navalis]|uniref:class I SAM-dependent methyltransferase n=1 Tax=Zarconia navalis TaxID=2992134 RepID=UPI0021F8A57D|nr:class I SAM-dependent methyltransferase [Zarconia navalis]